MTIHMKTIAKIGDLFEQVGTHGPRRRKSLLFERKILFGASGMAASLVCLTVLMTFPGCGNREIRKIDGAAEQTVLEPTSHNLYNRAVAAYRERDFESAANHFRQALKHTRDPQFIASVRYNLGMILLEQGNLEGARTALIEVLELSPRHIKACINLGVVLEKMGRYARAVNHYRKALENHPDNPEILNNFMVVLRLNGRLDKAEQVGHGLLASDPKNFRVLSNLSLIYLDSGKLSMSESIGLRILKSVDTYGMGDPDLELIASVHNNLGVVYLRMQKTEKALVHFKKALDADPNHIDALLNLGSLYGRFHHYNLAGDVFQRAVNLDPNHRVALKGLGSALYGAGMTDRAEEHLSRVIQLDPNDAQTYFILGELYHHTVRDMPRAEKFYKEYKRLRGNYLQPDDLVHQRLHELESASR